MSKCRLCQQINNNLKTIYSNRLKSLAQTVLKLKGFKDSLDANKTFEICENCKQGIENVSIFWENIPKAKSDSTVNTDVIEIHDETQRVLSNVEFNSVSKQGLLALTPAGQEQYENKASSTSIESNREPIKIRIKLPRKRKRESKPTAIATSEPLEKRVRRCPKRYENFDITPTVKKKSFKRYSKADFYLCSEKSLKNSTQVAFLRLSDGQDVGKLVEVDSKVPIRIRIICRICGQVFRFEKSFQKHFKAHNNYQLKDSESIIKNYLYYCKLCDKSFPGHYNVRKHFFSAHSEERPLKCQYCEACFKYKNNLDYHMAKHVPKTRFECAFCKKMFLKRYELQIHIRSHTKEKPYKCDLCAFAAAHRSNLKTHQKIKHLNSSTNSVNFKENVVEQVIPVHKFMPPQAIIEEEEVLYPDLYNKNISDVTLRSNFVENLSNENIEINFSETQRSSENTTLPDAKLITTNDNNILEVSEVNEACKENILAKPNFGSFKFNCSILETLPSSTLLGLKKWPKSFQGVPTQDLEHTLNNESSKQAGYQSQTFKLEKDIHNSADTLKSIVKYAPLQKSSSGNLTQIANYNTTHNMSNTTQSVASFISSISNKKTRTNLDVSSRSILTNGGEFINISELSKSSTKQHQDHLSDIMQAEIVENKFKITQNSSDTRSENISLETNGAQSRKVIKVSARPVKIKNILNLKNAKSSNTTTYEGDTISKISNEFVTNNSLTFLKTNIQQIETSKCFTNTEVPENNTNPFSTYNNIKSQQSLLKPNLRTQHIANLSLTKNFESQSILAAKPLITKIEILPPLNTLDILQKSLLTDAATKLIKPPTDYKHQCHYCYKYFKQKSAFTKHLRTHTGEKPYKCNLCPKSYADASNYKKHKILHKNAADALNISGTAPYAVQSSPAYSTVSDPDPDGIEVMQTLKMFECSSTEDDDEDVDDASTTSSTIESHMWQDALEHALNNVDIRDNFKRNLAGINNAILPKSMQQILDNTDTNENCSTEHAD